MSKTYRLRSRETEAISDKRIKMIIERHEDIKESDILGTLVWKHLGGIKYSDVLAYREEVLKKA